MITPTPAVQLLTSIFRCPEVGCHREINAGGYLRERGFQERNKKSRKSFPANIILGMSDGLSVDSGNFDLSKILSNNTSIRIIQTNLIFR